MSGNSSTWMDTSPVWASCIGYALDENFLISLRDEHSGTRTEQSQRKVQMVSSCDLVLHTYECGEDGITPVLVCPRRVTQNYNSDVCVVNAYEVGTDAWNASVCVFYEDGGLKFIYSGHDGKLNLRGISCESMCNIILVNFIDDSVHVISSEGSFLKYLFTSDTCLPQPRALALHRGVLWVGSMEGEVRVYGYKH